MMTLVTLFAALLALASLPGTLLLALLTVAAMVYRPRPVATASRTRLAVVIPAHNEAAHIERCVASVLESAAANAAADTAVVVVADNCEDDTAALATAAGARVLERHDSQRRGKGYALDHAFRTLATEPFDAFVVVDADSVVSTHFVAAMAARFADGADAVQCRYTALNAHASLRTRLMNVALMAFNVLRPRGREALGLSAGILGNGFGLSAGTLAAVPYVAASVVEDLEYHIMLVRHGRRVHFVDDAWVRADMPTGGTGSRTQRARWEGGRLLMLRKHLAGLVREVLSGKPRLLEPAMDLMLLPLAWHVLLILPLLLLPVPLARAYGVVALAVLLLHVLAALRIGGGGLRDLLALAAAPLYIVWKLTVLRLLRQTAREDAAWVRTRRETQDQTQGDPAPGTKDE